MPITGHWQALAEMFAGRMLNSVAEGLVIALLGWVVLCAMRRQNSSTRFAMWFAALAAVVLLPIVESARSNAGASAVHSALRLPGYWAVDLFVLWLVIVSVGLAKIVFGFWQLRKLRKSCRKLDTGSLPSVLQNTLAEYGSGRSINICTSELVRMPTALGFVKPVVVLPAWAMEELTPAELNAVLLHELGHLRRWDDWTNLSQKIVSALLFFHPAVWWIVRGLAREREMACDDFVLAATSDRRGYAECLVSVAEKNFLRRSLALAQAMAGRMKLTAARVARILDVRDENLERTAATKIWKPALGVVVTFSAVCLISLPRAPRLIAFESSDSASVSRMAAVESPSSFGAKMVPAKFAGSPLGSDVRAAHAVIRHASWHSVNHAKKNVLTSAASVNSATPAKLAQNQADSPRLFNANAKISDDRSDLPNAVLVIMQTEQVDEAGRVWSVSIWRLTVYHPTDRAMDRAVQKGITPKST
jgi:beta-lactamase regulating signal transducer with metallopeptidase domain